MAVHDPFLSTHTVWRDSYGLARIVPGNDQLHRLDGAIETEQRVQNPRKSCDQAGPAAR
jgi:hypothetical protein